MKEKRDSSYEVPPRTAGEVMSLLKCNPSDSELKSRFGPDHWKEISENMDSMRKASARFHGMKLAWIAEWSARTPEIKDTAVFDWSDIISMVQYNGEGTPEASFTEWGRSIANAVREGKASQLRALANYVEKLQRARPPSRKPGIKQAWPDKVADLKPPTKAAAKRALALAKSVRELTEKEIPLTRAEVARQAGLKTVGGNYTSDFKRPGLIDIPTHKSGVPSKVPTRKRTPKQ